QDARRRDEPGEELHEVAPGLPEGIDDDVLSRRTHEWEGLVQVDYQCARRHARPQVAESPLVALDLLANAGELTLHREHVLQLPGSAVDQLDEPCLEATGVGETRSYVYEVFAHVLGVLAHGFQLADWLESIDRVGPAIVRERS